MTILTNAMTCDSITSQQKKTVVELEPRFDAKARCAAPMGGFFTTYLWPSGYVHVFGTAFAPETSGSTRNLLGRHLERARAKLYCKQRRLAMNANNTPILSFENNDVTLIEGDYRVHDLALAQALGFERPRKIRELIKRHIKTLENLGEVINRPTVGRYKSNEYHLNQKQAVFLCTKSSTNKATEITIELVEVFIAARNGTLSAPHIAPPSVEYIAVPLLEWERLTRKARAAEALQELDNQITAMRQIMLKGMDSMAYSPEMPLIRGIKQ